MSRPTEKEAAAALATLIEYHGEPVMPVSAYCERLYEWMAAIEALNANPRDGVEEQGSNYHHLLGAIEMDISKSNLLYRTIYCGRPKRSTPCPVHKGHWAGLAMEPPNAAAISLAGYPNPTSQKASRALTRYSVLGQQGHRYCVLPDQLPVHLRQSRERRSEPGLMPVQAQQNEPTLRSWIRQHDIDKGRRNDWSDDGCDNSSMREGRAPVGAPGGEDQR